MVPSKRMTSHITYAYNEGCSLNIDPHPSFWVLCAYVTIMSFNQQAEPAMAGNLSSTLPACISIEMLLGIDPNLAASLICHFVTQQHKLGQFVAEAIASDVHRFLRWYQGHRNFILHNHQPDTLESELSALNHWSNSNGIGAPAKWETSLSVRFSAVIVGIGTIWLDLPLDGRPLTIREEFLPEILEAMYEELE